MTKLNVSAYCLLVDCYRLVMVYVLSSLIQRKTKVGTFEISDVRPPRFIGRNGVSVEHCYNLLE